MKFTKQELSNLRKLTDAMTVKDAKYEIRNDDPRMSDFKIYEKDYNIKCENRGTYREWGEKVTYWIVTGKKQDILDFINDYNLDNVSEKISDSIKDGNDTFEYAVEEVVALSNGFIKWAKVKNNPIEMISL